VSAISAAVKSREKVIDLLLSQVIPLGASAATTLATAVILGASGRGELALIISGSTLTGAIFFLSLHVGIVRATRDGDPTAVRRGWSVGAVVAALLLALGLLLSMIAPVAPASGFGLFDRSIVLMTAIGGALVIYNLVVLRTRQGLGDSRVFRNSWFLQSILYPVLGIPVAIAFHSATLVVLCWYLALIASTAYGMLAKRRPASAYLDRSNTRMRTSRIVATSLAGHVGLVGQQLLFRGDVVVLGFFVSSASVGIYSIATPIAGLIWVFSEALSLLAFDSDGNNTSAELQAARRRKLVKMNFLFGAIGAIFIALASILFVPWLLPRYVTAVPLILILLPGVVVQGYARIGLSSLLTTGSRRAPITIGVGSAALSALYVPFVIAFGVVGAAIASSLIYILQAFVVALVIRHHTRHIQPTR
jgi:O-antigen/teichoic acid export membrane protein